MTTQQEAIATALAARGLSRTASTGRFEKFFDETQGTKYYVGKAGALRRGATVRGSVPVNEAFRSRLLLEGGYFGKKAIPVFVYGTLKEGYWNCRRFLSESTKVAEVRTAGAFHLRDVGFPIASVFGPTVRPIAGELWTVSGKTLTALDILEGVPHLYQRQAIVVRKADGSSSAAWMYVQEQPRMSAPECPVIEGAYVWSPPKIPSQENV